MTQIEKFILLHDGPWDRISVNHGFLLGPSQSHHMNHRSIAFMRAWYTDVKRNDNLLSTSAKDVHLKHARCYSDLQNVAKAIINALQVDLPKESTNVPNSPLLSNTSRYLCCSSSMLDPVFIIRSIQGLGLDESDDPPVSMDVAPVR